MSPRKFFVGKTIGFIVVVVLVGAFFLFNSYVYKEKQGEGGMQAGYKDTSYSIDGQSVQLINGVAEVEAAPGSASKVTTRVFGNEAEGDLNGDGVSDIAFIITQNMGGTGTFYYVVAGFKTDTGYVGSNAILLGDRVAPQSTQIQNKQIIVNFAERKAGEPMTAAPSVGVTKYISIQGTELVEVAGVPLTGDTP